MQRCYFFSEVAVLQKKKSYINNFTTYLVEKLHIFCTKSKICAYFRMFSGGGTVLDKFSF